LAKSFESSEFGAKQGPFPCTKAQEKAVEKQKMQAKKYF
jgi:hypothetical protein